MVVQIEAFSEKQLRVLTWWCRCSGCHDRDAIICDGAVRSGKTLCMTLSFVLWAFAAFDGQTFAWCGKTIGSLRRNVITPLIPLLKELGFRCKETLSQNRLVLARQGRENQIYYFGGRDESSAALIQGVTLAGVLFDEVALMPRGFVEQALARCSVADSRYWFNCNPEHPFHWFYREWIQKADEKNALYLHFTMEDNPSLSEKVKQRYRSLYRGIFFQRYIEGKWCAAEGLVYPMFRTEEHVVERVPDQLERYVISCDYGTINPASFGLWGKSGPAWYRLQEYYYDSKQTGEQRTDEEHYRALEELAGNRKIETVLVDPSAASFLECIRRHGHFSVRPAKNEVLSGIRRVGDALRERKIFFSASCRDSLREFSLYIWDQSSREDRPVKRNDHAMDEIRYFVNTILYPSREEFFALSVERNT